MDNGLISSLATALISETVMMIAAILLVCAIVLALIARKKALRTVCAVVIALCVLYLLLMGALVYFSSSNPGPMG